MKYFVLLCDGAADRKKMEPGFKTPLEAAVKPSLNMLSYRSFNGYISGATNKFRADVDAAHLAALGYDPDELDGLAAFDAASVGITLDGEDTAYRCSFVTLSDNGEPYAEKTLLGFGGADVTREETVKLVSTLNKGLSTKIKKFQAVTGGEGCLVWKRAPEGVAFSAPSSVQGAIGAYLPTGSAAGRVLPLFEKSFDILKDHPVNVKRRERGALPLNSLWLWSPSKAPAFEPFAEKWQLSGATVITRQPSLKGAAICAGMKVIEASASDGAELSAAANTVIEEFTAGTDFVMLHTDIVSKAALFGDRDGKIKGIEAVDTLLIAPVYEYLCGCGDQFKLLVTTGMAALTDKKEYSAEDPVPFFMYNSMRTEVGYKPFSEINAGKGGFRLPDGCGYKFTSFMIRIPAPPEKEETQGEDGQQQQ